MFGRFPAVAGHLNCELLCPCSQGLMPRWCGVAALVAVCEMKPGSLPDGTQVQRAWIRAGVVNHGLWIYNSAAVRNFSESVCICLTKKSCSICRCSEGFYSDRLGSRFCPVSRPGRNAETGTEGNSGCGARCPGGAGESEAHLRRSAGAGTGVLICRGRKWPRSAVLRRRASVGEISTWLNTRMFRACSRRVCQQVLMFATGRRPAAMHVVEDRSLP